MSVSVRSETVRHRSHVRRSHGLTAVSRRRSDPSVSRSHGGLTAVSRRSHGDGGLTSVSRRSHGLTSVSRRRSDPSVSRRSHVGLTSVSRSHVGLTVSRRSHGLTSVSRRLQSVSDLAATADRPRYRGREGDRGLRGHASGSRACRPP